ncbi:MAG: TonB-dependent receptor [Chromatiales bacterium]|nr:TonB-dependent receptor [Chromatiales bacterium]
MSENHSLPLAFVLAVCVAPCAQALDEAIVVTPTRTVQSVADLPGQTIVIDTDAIASRQPRDLAQLLPFNVGVEIGGNGGPGQPVSTFIRGTDSNHTLLMIDGVPINPGTIGIAAIQNIATGWIDRVEIVEGPASTLYGSEAIGGAINLVPKRPRARGVSGEVFATAGGDDEQALGGVLTGREGPWWGTAMLERTRTDGFPSRVESDLDRGYERDTAFLSAGWSGAMSEFAFTHWRADGNTEYLDFFLTPLDQDFVNSAQILSGRAYLGEHLTSTLKLSRFVERIDQNQSDDYAHTRRHALDWQNDLRHGAHLITAGLTLSREDVGSLVFGSGYEERTDVRELFVQDDISIGRHRFIAGLRLHDHESAGTHTVWSASYRFRVSEQLDLYASAGTAFRAPDGLDRFGFGGNPDLAPERSRSAEVGLKWRSGGQQASLALFDTRIRDLINFEDPDGFLGPIPGRNENIDRARIRGVQGRWSLASGPWRLAAEAQWQRPRNETLGRDLARRAELGGVLSAAFVQPAFDVRLDALAQSDRFDSDFSDAQIAGYGRADLAARWRFAPGASIEARVENLTDRAYQTADGFNSQDRTMWVTLRYRLGSGVDSDSQL